MSSPVRPLPIPRGRTRGDFGLRAPLDEPRTKLAGARGLFLLWGWVNLGSSILMEIYPYRFPYNDYIWLYLFVSNTAFCAFSLFALRLPIRLKTTVVLFLLLAAWGMFTALLADRELGEAVSSTHIYFWPLYYIAMFYAVSFMVYVEPKTRKWAIWAYMCVIGLSCFVGVLQFFHFGPAMALSYAGNFGPTKETVRANGLAGFASFLGFQASVALAFFVGRLRKRKLMPMEMVGFFFFSFVIVIAQFRSLYFGLMILWIVAFVFSIRREGLPALRYPVLAALFTILPLVFFTKSFTYTLSSKLTNDPSLLYRERFSWSQLDYIYRERPWTGIGPRTTIMMGGFASVGNHGEIAETSYYTKWTSHVMDCTYRMFLACYGIPGLALGILAMASGILGALRVARSKGESVDRHALATSATLVCISLAIVCYLTDLIMYVGATVQAVLVLALMSRTWQEERDAGGLVAEVLPSTPSGEAKKQAASARKTLAKPAR